VNRGSEGGAALTGLLRLYFWVCVISWMIVTVVGVILFITVPDMRLNSAMLVVIFAIASSLGLARLLKKEESFESTQDTGGGRSVHLLRVGLMVCTGALIGEAIAMTYWDSGFTRLVVSATVVFSFCLLCAWLWLMLRGKRL